MDYITIVIVCYNCGEDIVNALDDIKKGDYDITKIEFIIVDNESHDGSVEILKAYQGLNIKVIESKDNIGFGRGCNLAIPEIQGQKTLFLNPDVRLNKSSLINLVQFSNDNPSAKVWGGQTVTPEGKPDGQNAWREPSLLGILCWSFFGDLLLKKFSKRIPDAYTANEIKELPFVDSISGCFLLIDSDLLKQLNGFDERFFMYSEEVDLCRRARGFGAKPMSTADAVIVHEGSKTITSKNKLNFLYHSKLKYCKKHWHYFSYLIARISVLSGSVIRSVIYSLLSFNTFYRKEALIWWAFCKQQIMWKV